jgi:hypothetical protein
MRPVRAGRSRTHVPFPVLAVLPPMPGRRTADFGSATFSSELETHRARNTPQCDTTVGVWSATASRAANPRVPTPAARRRGPASPGPSVTQQVQHGPDGPEDAIGMGSSGPHASSINGEAGAGRRCRFPANMVRSRRTRATTTTRTGTTLKSPSATLKPRAASIAGAVSQPSDRWAPASPRVCRTSSLPPTTIR